jgi:hypothetical protein
MEMQKLARRRRVPSRDSFPGLSAAIPTVTKPELDEGE